MSIKSKKIYIFFKLLFDKHITILYNIKIILGYLLYSFLKYIFLV